jgi:hypothetical protein
MHILDECEPLCPALSNCNGQSHSFTHARTRTHKMCKNSNSLRSTNRLLGGGGTSCTPAPTGHGQSRDKQENRHYRGPGHTGRRIPVRSSDQNSTEKLTVAQLLLPIRGVSGSNLGLETGYCPKAFRGFSFYLHANAEMEI